MRRLHDASNIRNSFSSQCTVFGGDDRQTKLKDPVAGMQGTSPGQPWQLVYEGEFVKGQREGTGTCYYSTGEVYTGGWHGNKRTGSGDAQAHLKEGKEDARSRSIRTASRTGGWQGQWQLCCTTMQKRQAILVFKCLTQHATFVINVSRIAQPDHLLYAA
jgi:hypothetical protein